MAKPKTTEENQESAPETAAAAQASERQPGDEPRQRPKTFAPDRFAIAVDKAAGVRLAENRRNREMQLSFDDKPPQAVIDQVFPLMTNDESSSVAEALLKYKYQPFVEKRHEQLKSVST